MQAIKPSICNKIKEAREKLGLSPIDLASKANVDPWLIRRIEVSGKTPDQATLKKLKKVITIPD